MNEEAELVLENVELYNLSPGALSIQVANIEFKNIKINGPCNCEQTARKLTLCPRQPRMDPTRFNVEKRYCEEITKDLVNALTCQVCATINLQWYFLRKVNPMLQGQHKISTLLLHGF